MNKSLLILISITFLITILSCSTISKAQTSASPSDAKELVGRWEGRVSISGPTMAFTAENTSYFALEIFALEGTERVVYRGICPMCLTQQWFSDKGILIDKKNSIGLEIPERFELWVYKRGNPPSDGFITTKNLIFLLKGDRLSGYAAGFIEASAAEFILKKTPDIKYFIPQKDLIGRWVREPKDLQEEIIINEIDKKNKTIKGRYKVDSKEYELTDARFTDEDRLTIDFKTSNNQHYQLSYYPDLSEFPPVLWGSLETEGKVLYPMFKKE